MGTSAQNKLKNDRKAAEAKAYAARSDKAAADRRARDNASRSSSSGNSPKSRRDAPSKSSLRALAAGVNPYTATYDGTANQVGTAYKAPAKTPVRNAIKSPASGYKLNEVAPAVVDLGNPSTWSPAQNSVYKNRMDELLASAIPYEQAHRLAIDAVGTMPVQPGFTNTSAGTAGPTGNGAAPGAVANTGSAGAVGSGATTPRGTSFVDATAAFNNATFNAPVTSVSGARVDAPRTPAQMSRDGDPMGVTSNDVVKSGGAPGLIKAVDTDVARDKAASLENPAFDAPNSNGLSAGEGQGNAGDAFSEFGGMIGMLAEKWGVPAAVVASMLMNRDAAANAATIQGKAATDAATTQAKAAAAAGVISTDQFNQVMAREKDIYDQQRTDTMPARAAGATALNDLQTFDRDNPDLNYDPTNANLNTRNLAAFSQNNPDFKVDPFNFEAAHGTANEIYNFNKNNPEFKADPFKFNNDDPSYSFRFNEGMKALQNSAAARGGLLSGNTGKALANYGQEAASQEYQNAFNRYQSSTNDAFNRNMATRSSKLGALQAASQEHQNDFNMYTAHTGNMFNRQQAQRSTKLNEMQALGQAYQGDFNRVQAQRGSKLNALQSMAGMGQSAVQQSGQAGQSYANNTGQASQSYANNAGQYGMAAGNATAGGQVGAGNAMASGYMGGSNAVAGGLSQAINYGQSNALLDALKNMRR